MFILGLITASILMVRKPRVVEIDMSQEERQKYNDIMEEATNVINYLESRDCNE